MGSYAKTADYGKAREQYAKLSEIWAGRDNLVEMQEIQRFLETTKEQ